MLWNINMLIPHTYCILNLYKTVHLNYTKFISVNPPPPPMNTEWCTTAIHHFWNLCCHLYSSSNLMQQLMTVLAHLGCQRTKFHSAGGHAHFLRPLLCTSTRFTEYPHGIRFPGCIYKIAEVLGMVHTRDRQLLWGRRWRVGPKLVFDQMAAPVHEIIDGSGIWAQMALKERSAQH
jgi:hypothetical protein